MFAWVVVAGIAATFVVVVLLLMGLGRQRLHGWILRLEVEEAQRRFLTQREELQSQCRTAYRKQGFSRNSQTDANDRPDEIQSSIVEFHGRPIFLRDSLSGDILALVGVTILYQLPRSTQEPIHENDMVGQDDDTEYRLGTASFFHRMGRWSTSGHVFLNLEPWEIAHQWMEKYDLLPAPQGVE